MIEGISCFDNNKFILKKSGINKSKSQNMPFAANAGIPASNYGASYYPLISFGQGSRKGAISPSSVVERKTTRIEQFFKTTGIENISTSNKTLNGDCYEELSNNLALLLGPDKNVVLKADTDVDAEILVRQFAKNINNQKYDGQGFPPQNTDVFFVNNIYNVEEVSLPTKGKSFLTMLDDLSHAKDGRKKIVFINDIRPFTDALISSGEINFKSYVAKNIPNISIVGIVPKAFIDLTTDEFNALAVDGVTPTQLKEVFKGQSIFELNGLSTQETKKFLELNPEYVQNILKRYKKVNLSIEQDAINGIIDKTALALDGAFPAKALKVIDIMATAKANEAVFSGEKQAKIDFEYSKNFFAHNSDLINSLKTKNTGVSIADNIKTRFSDLGGIRQVKEELSDVLEYAKNPKEYLKRGRKIPEGVLLTGPPGTGKTSIARALAGEAGIPMVYASGSDFGTGIVDSGANDIKALFAKTREVARQSEKKAVLLFLDEIDALGKKRTGEMNNSEDEKKLNALLVELDGFNKDSDVKIVPVAATNRPEILDSALVRSGRYGHEIKVPAPALKQDRLEIFEIYAKNKPFKTLKQKAEILDEFAEITDGLAGDKISQIMDNAMRVIDKKNRKFITFDDMFEGYMQAMIGRKTVTDQLPVEKRRTVIHEAGHADASAALKHGKVSFISNEARGDSLGSTWITNSATKYSESFESFLKEGAVDFSGGEAERLFLGRHASGVSKDYESMTSLINTAIKRYGFGVFTPQMSFFDENGKERLDLTEMYKKQIKKDNDLFRKTMQKLSKKSLKFDKDFIKNVYMKKYDDEIKINEGGNSFSGKTFMQIRQDWLIKKRGVKAQTIFDKKIDIIIDAAYNANKGFFERIARKLIRAIK